MILIKKIFWNSTILKKKIIFKKQFLKKKLHLHTKSIFDSIYPVKFVNFAFYVLFWKTRFLWKFFFLKSMSLNVILFLNSWFWIKNFSVEHDFEWIFFRFVRFWIKLFTTCKILNQFFEDASDFKLNILHRVRFWVYFFSSWPSFHVFNKTVHVSVMIEYMALVWLVKLVCQDRLCLPQLWST